MRTLRSYAEKWAKAGTKKPGGGTARLLSGIVDSGQPARYHCNGESGDRKSVEIPRFSIRYEPISTSKTNVARTIANAAEIR